MPALQVVELVRRVAHDDPDRAHRGHGQAADQQTGYAGEEPDPACHADLPEHAWCQHGAQGTPGALVPMSRHGSRRCPERVYGAPCGTVTIRQARRPLGNHGMAQADYAGNGPNGLWR